MEILTTQLRINWALDREKPTKELIQLCSKGKDIAFNEWTY